MMKFSNALKAKNRRDARRKKKKRPLQKFQNHLYHIMGPRILDLVLFEKRKSASDLTKARDQATLEMQIQAIHELGDQMLLQGNYLAVINSFRQASETLSNLNLLKAAKLFSRRAEEIYNLLKLRADFLTTLEREKPAKNLAKMKLLYNEIIEISKKLNDTFWVDAFQREFEKCQRDVASNRSKIKKRTWSRTGNLQSKLYALLEAPASLSESNKNQGTFSLKSEVQKFAIEALEHKRNHLEDQAGKLEKQSEFRSAATFYEKCERLTQHIIQLGKLDEQANLKLYRTKRLACLNRKSERNE